MKHRKSNRKTRDTFAANIAEIVLRHGGKEVEARRCSNGFEFAAKYRLDSAIGVVNISGNNQDTTVAVYMRFDGDMKVVNARIPWDELNHFSGKCNIHLWAGQEAAVLETLDERLTFIRTLAVQA